jgi:hypothetical protein
MAMRFFMEGVKIAKAFLSNLVVHKSPVTMSYKEFTNYGKPFSERDWANLKRIGKTHGFTTSMDLDVLHNLMRENIEIP